MTENDPVETIRKTVGNVNSDEELAEIERALADLEDPLSLGYCDPDNSSEQFLSAVVREGRVDEYSITTDISRRYGEAQVFTVDLTITANGWDLEKYDF